MHSVSLGPRTAAFNRCSLTQQNTLLTSHSNKCSGYVLGFWETAQCFPEECHLHKSQWSYCCRFSVFLETMKGNCPGVWKLSAYRERHTYTYTHTHAHARIRTYTHTRLQVDSNLRGLKNTASNMQMCLQPGYRDENSRLTAGNSHFRKVAKCLRWLKKTWIKNPQCHQKVPEAKERKVLLPFYIYTFPLHLRRFRT